MGTKVLMPSYMVGWLESALDCPFDKEKGLCDSCRTGLAKLIDSVVVPLNPPDLSDENLAATPEVEEYERRLLGKLCELRSAQPPSAEAFVSILPAIGDKTWEALVHPCTWDAIDCARESTMLAAANALTDKLKPPKPELPDLAGMTTDKVIVEINERLRPGEEYGLHHDGSACMRDACDQYIPELIPSGGGLRGVLNWLRERDRRGDNNG